MSATTSPTMTVTTYFSAWDEHPRPCNSIKRAVADMMEEGWLPVRSRNGRLSAKRYRDGDQSRLRVSLRDPVTGRRANLVFAMSTAAEGSRDA